jgi:hypothetical protein
VIRSRSYAVPLTAVLLALATGVALGAGPLDDTRSDASTGPRVTTQAPESTYADTFAASVGPRLYADGLSRRPVALVIMPGADPATVAAMTSQIKAAGGQVSASYAVQSQLVDGGQKSLVDTLGVQLAQQVRTKIDKKTSTYPRIGRLVAVAVADTGGSGVPPDDDAAAVRQSLAAAHLLTVPSGNPENAPLVLVVMGPAVDQAIADGFLSGLASGARGVVAVAPTRDATLSALHEDGVTRHVTTVDGSETSAGRVAGVLALIRSVKKQGGAFGASGSDGPVPLG